MGRISDGIRLTGRYINYLIKSKHYKGHGLHSPFIFDFSTNVLFKKESDLNYSAVEKYKSKLKNSSQVVEMSDFGAGSRRMDKVKRKVSDILAFSTTQKKYGKLLSRIVAYYRANSIIELGTSLGIGSFYLSQPLSSSGFLFTVEGAKELAQIPIKHFEAIDKENIKVINGRFETVLPELLNKLETIDLVFFDGNHTMQATIDYFNQCVKKINNQSIFIFDDIHWSDEMEDAWKYIQSHPKCRVCIDLFQFGIVFFRKELSAQNYIIRF